MLRPQAFQDPYYAQVIAPDEATFIDESALSPVLFNTTVSISMFGFRRSGRGAAIWCREPWFRILRVSISTDWTHCSSAS